MKIAVALRTCTSVLNYWKSARFVKDDKSTITLTCLKSLLTAIKSSDHEIVLSIHDDNSFIGDVKKMEALCDEYDIPVTFIRTEHHGNFKTQYEWVNSTDCDYIYCVEDDYLHKANSINAMAEAVILMQDVFPSDYAVFPFNCPHRYIPAQLYPSYILRLNNVYWRSVMHSTHTFFISKKGFTEYNDIMKHQAYAWPNINEDDSINHVWADGRIKLISPLTSLAFHLADESQKEPNTNWEWLYKFNYYRGGK